MIYELCCLANSDATETEIAKVSEIISSSVKDFSGELVLEDNWGMKTLAQPTSSGKTKANYQYFIYKTDNADLNKEILRRLKISEFVMKYGIFSLGDDSNAADVIKNFKTPFSKKFNGSITDEDDEESEGGKKRFTRGKSCWFTAKQLRSDWKDPQTYSWLVNEFGKVLPARVSGVSRKHQRYVTTAIKRARNLGVLSHVSNRTLD
jgi:ribosomal protein S18/ribosomal protein S6